MEALRRGDSSGIARLAADGVSTTGIPTEDVGTPLDLSVSSARVEVRGVGAVVSGTALRRITTPDGRQAGTQPLLFSEVWIQRNGEWQLMNVRFANASAPR